MFLTAPTQLSKAFFILKGVLSTHKRRNQKKTASSIEEAAYFYQSSKLLLELYGNPTVE